MRIGMFDLSLRLRRSLPGSATVAAVAVAWSACSLAGCETPPARAEQAPAATAVTWRPLGTWSGRGSRQTESFDVISGAMRLRWQTSGGPADGSGRFRVSLYSAISGRPLQVVVERQGPGEGSAYVEDEPRVSYLVIDSDEIEWTATLEEAVGKP